MALLFKMGRFLAPLLKHFVASSLLSVTLFHELVMDIWQASREDPNMADARFFFGVCVLGIL
jgi:hypothetical protein